MTLKRNLKRRELPQYKCTLPISKLEVTYRPYTIKEQKILDINGSSENVQDKFNAVKQVISLCSDIGEHINTISAPDFDYLFIQIYKVSDSASIPFVYTKNCCDEGNPEINLILDLDKHIQIINLDKQDDYSTPYQTTGRIINLVDDYQLVLSNKMVDIDPSNLDVSSILYQILIGVIDKGEFLPKETISETEFNEFFESFKPSELSTLRNYIEHLPALIADVTVICPNCKTKHHIKQTGLLSFLV